MRPTFRKVVTTFAFERFEMCSGSKVIDIDRMPSSGYEKTGCLSEQNVKPRDKGEEISDLEHARSTAPIS